VEDGQTLTLTLTLALTPTQDGTVGAVIGQQTGCDKEDPHAHLSGGAFPRSALLENPNPTPTLTPALTLTRTL